MRDDHQSAGLSIEAVLQGAEGSVAKYHTTFNLGLTVGHTLIKSLKVC